MFVTRTVPPLRKFLASISAVILLATTLPALALTPLNQEEHINNSLISAGIADEIRKNCSTVNARMFRALKKAKDLENYARDKGYSEPEVKAFLKSKTERKRVKQAIDDYLAENSVVKGNEATYCSLGRAEITKGSLIGQLLWTW